MWGNGLGWTIATILAALMAAGAVMVQRTGLESAPTSFGLDRENLGKLSLPVSPDLIVPMGDGGDAASLYRKAAADLQQNRESYEAFLEKGKSKDVIALSGLALLIEASNARCDGIFRPDPAEIMNYHPQRPVLDDLIQLGQLSARAALLMRQTNPEMAKKHFNAEFALGRALFEERLTRQELLGGLELIAESTNGLIMLADGSGNSPRLLQLREFDEKRKAFYMARIQPMLRVVTSVDANVIAEHNGDIFYLARHAEEPVWKIESVFALGRMRYHVGTDGRIGDQTSAMRLLRKLSDDPDALTKLAARAARDLTIEEYRRQH